MTEHDPEVPSQASESTEANDPERHGSEEVPAGVPGHSFVLFNRYQAGDEQALNELFDRYYTRVHGIVRSRMGNRLGKYFEEDDIAQATFVSALKGVPGFEWRHDAAFYSWLSTIVENILRALVRKLETEKRDWNLDTSDTVILDDGSEFTITGRTPGREPTPSQDLAAKEKADWVEHCLSELPEEEREVILLRDYMEHSWNEVARSLERPSADSASNLHKGAVQHWDRLIARKFV